MQPFTEEYFVDDEAKVRFYTGLPGFDVLKVTFVFISPFVTQKIACEQASRSRITWTVGA